ncbi:MAG: fumarylacetoacetate hydrolase family protein [Candidatus Competibacterales bacterium]|nr:fumarylacetoacetate hydrolase family protein [Candidatus Competibacterales bacterium]
MKLLRYGPPGAEKPGLLDADGRLRDLSAQVADIDTSVLAPQRLAELAALDPSTLPEVAGNPRLGPPLTGVGKFIGIGLNYADHAAEIGIAPPTEPIVFMKAITAINGPHDPVELPPGSVKTDWEVELGVVIGRRAKYVDEAAALAHVAGYCVVNDISEREYQIERGGTWDKGKGFDTFGPLGPWLVTRDEVPDPQDLRLWLELDGERCQDGSTRTMIFGVAALVSYLSRCMRLEPGDVIATGTPPGVGMGRKPPRFLRPGDQLRAGVEGLGEQRTTVRAAP